MSFRRSFEIAVGRREINEARLARGALRYLPTFVPWFGLGAGLPGALVQAMHVHVVLPLSTLATREACTAFAEAHFDAFATTYRCYAELTIAFQPPLDEAASAVMGLNRLRPLDDHRDEQVARAYRTWLAAYVLGLLVMSVETRTAAASECAMEMARTGRMNSELQLDIARSLRRPSRIGAA